MSNPTSPLDPEYLLSSYDEKKAYLQSWLRQEIYDFEYALALPEEEDLDALEDEVRDELLENIQNLASDIADGYSRMIIEYIHQMVLARLSL